MVRIPVPVRLSRTRVLRTPTHPISVSEAWRVWHIAPTALALSPFPALWLREIPRARIRSNLWKTIGCRHSAIIMPHFHLERARPVQSPIFRLHGEPHVLATPSTSGCDGWVWRPRGFGHHHAEGPVRKNLEQKSGGGDQSARHFAISQRGGSLPDVATTVG
jgi:hypothetical protein